MPKFKNGLAKVGETYHYCIKLNGRYLRGSTRARDKGTAEKVLADIRRKAVLSADALPHSTPTIKEMVNTWMKTQQNVLSIQHVHNIDQIMRDWVIPIVSDCRIDQVSTPMILDVRSKMLEAGRSPSTANHMIRVVRLLWNFAVRIGLIDRVPFKVSQLRVQRKPRPTISLGRVGEFFAAVDQASQNPQIRTMIRMMVGLGLRASEVRMARWKWLDAEGRTYSTGKLKNKRVRVIPVPDWLWHHLVNLPGKLSEWMFPNRVGVPYGPTFLCRYITIASALLGVPRLSQHRLRGSFATIHASIGTPIPDIQTMLGHRSIVTTLTYIETNLEAKRKAQDTLSQKLGLV